MNILFVVAHPDDEAYGPYGTIINCVKDGHHVTVFSLCNGQRPGSEYVAAGRVDSFIKNCEDAGATWIIGDNSDLTLTRIDTMKEVERVVQQVSPQIIYTHSISDLNWDHRIVAEACIIASRPKPNNVVHELYFFEVPSSSDWTFSQIQPIFSPNVYKDISNVIDLKEAALNRYTTETYDFPDARSVEAMVTLAKYRGYQSGLNRAEAFQLVFSRDHKN